MQQNMFLSSLSDMYARLCLRRSALPTRLEKHIFYPCFDAHVSGSMMVLKEGRDGLFADFVDSFGRHLGSV